MKREHWSTWYAGSEAQWKALPISERDRLSFEHTGCECAYPTWPAPVDCVHGGCLYRRGETTRAALVNQSLRAERERGWLRFDDIPRERIARVYRAVRNACREQGTYDIWKAWPAIVYGGVA